MKFNNVSDRPQGSTATLRKPATKGEYMATTAIFIEIVIIGLFSSGWMFLLLARLGVIDPSVVVPLLQNSKEWSVLILVIFGAVAYQLGSLTNTLCYGLMEVVAGKRIRNPIIPNAKYETVR